MGLERFTERETHCLLTDAGRKWKASRKALETKIIETLTSKGYKSGDNAYTDTFG